jgi:hypothetical protein
MRYPEPRTRFQNRVSVDLNAIYSRANSSDEPVLIENTRIKKEPSEDTSNHRSVPEFSESQENISEYPPTSPAALEDSDDTLDPAEAPAGPPTVSSESLSPQLDDVPDTVVVKKICTCPINSKCKVKRNGEIDCRTLVLEDKEWRDWKKRFHEDSRPGYAFHFWKISS